MLKLFKYGLITLVVVLVCVTAIAYSLLRLSLPTLDGTVSSSHIDSPIKLDRDILGHAVITADTFSDAAYALGVAHAQDRLFQMDTQRRAASGQLSELVGGAALSVDKRARFYQFQRRAQKAVSQLLPDQQQWLTRYAQGVNDTVDGMTALPFEYLLLRKHFAPWQTSDSLLVLFSMYMDLQVGQVNRDLALTRIAYHYGQPMVDFLLQSSSYQAALDGSLVNQNAPIPTLPPREETAITELRPLPDYGSNNWAVTGALTDSPSAMVANDMHLGLRVPIIWYRAQLNYQHHGEDISVTGVSLPGVPGIVVGSNGHIAWGFTNANLDNTDWVELSYTIQVESLSDPIELANGTEEPFVVEVSGYGPVKRVGSENYALKWVALTDYAANLNIVNLAHTQSVANALGQAHSFGMPVQNFVVVDDTGNAAWSPAGAVTARKTPSNTAISDSQVDSLWAQAETNLPQVVNPDNQRLWTANARVISANDLARFGDGGYALGARGMQIRDRLFENEQFDEAQFYAIQLDNEARFLTPWHELLTTLMSQSPKDYSAALAQLNKWQGCACPDSVGYTLVDKFRAQVISALFTPLSNRLQQEDVSFRPVIRHLEPATWALINNKSSSWLPTQYADFDTFLLGQFDTALENLWEQHGDEGKNWQQLRWGTVNQLSVKHPLSRALPALSTYLDMPAVDGFGDSFMPAAQARGFGASQRFFARPGDLDKAILTLPGGQSGHPLSPFYRLGFTQYADNENTPLLPQQLLHSLTIEPL